MWHFTEYFPDNLTALLNKSAGDINTSKLQDLFIDDGYSKTRFALGLFMTFLMGTAIMGNILVLLAICKNRSLRRLNNYLIVSLAVTDLLAAFLIMPFFTTDLFYNSAWIFPKEMCPPYTGLALSYSVVSVLNVIAISLERVFMITQPMSYQRVVTSARMLAVIVSIWVLGFTYGMLQMLWFVKEELKRFSALLQVQRCHFNPSFEFAMVHICVLFFIPLLVMIGAYLKIFDIVQSHMKRIKPSMRDTFDETLSEISINRSNRLDDLNSVEVRPNSVYDSISGSRRGPMFTTDASMLSLSGSLTRQIFEERRLTSLNRNNIISNVSSNNQLHVSDCSTSGSFAQSNACRNPYWRRLRTVFKFLDFNRQPHSRSHDDKNDFFEHTDDFTKDQDSGLGVDLKCVSTTEGQDFSINDESTRDNNDIAGTIDIPNTNEETDRTNGNDSIASNEPVATSPEAINASENLQQSCNEIANTKKAVNISVLITTPDGKPLNVRNDSLESVAFIPTSILKKPRRERSWNDDDDLRTRPRVHRPRKRSNSDSIDDPSIIGYNNEGFSHNEGVPALGSTSQRTADRLSSSRDIKDNTTKNVVNSSDLETSQNKSSFLTVRNHPRYQQRSRSLPENSLDSEDGDSEQLQPVAICTVCELSSGNISSESDQSDLQKERRKSSQLTFHELHTSGILADEDAKQSVGDIDYMSSSDPCIHEAGTRETDFLTRNFRKQLLDRNLSPPRKHKNFRLKQMPRNADCDHEASITESPINTSVANGLSQMQNQYKVVFLEPVPEATTPELEKYNQKLESSPIIPATKDNNFQVENEEPEIVYVLESNAEPFDINRSVQDLSQLAKSSETIMQWREFETPEKVLFLQTTQPEQNPGGRVMDRKKQTSVSFSYAKCYEASTINLKRSCTVDNLNLSKTPVLIPLNRLKLQSALKRGRSHNTVASNASKRGSVVFKLHDEEISVVDGRLTIQQVLNKSEDSNNRDCISCCSNNMVAMETTDNIQSNQGQQVVAQGQQQVSQVVWNPASQKHTDIWARRHFQAESMFGSTQSLHHNAITTEGQANGARLGRRSRPSIRKRLQENKAARMSAYVIGAFALCWLPYKVLFLVVASCENNCVPDIAWNFVTVTMFLQAAINPFIYNFYSSEFRRATRNLFLAKKNRVRPGYLN